MRALRPGGRRDLRAVHCGPAAGVTCVPCTAARLPA
jgi:hypothetical protein